MSATTLSQPQITVTAVELCIVHYLMPFRPKCEKTQKNFLDHIYNGIPVDDVIKGVAFYNRSKGEHIYLASARRSDGYVVVLMYMHQKWMQLRIYKSGVRLIVPSNNEAKCYIDYLQRYLPELDHLEEELVCYQIYLSRPIPDTHPLVKRFSVKHGSSFFRVFSTQILQSSKNMVVAQQDRVTFLDSLSCSNPSKL